MRIAVTLAQPSGDTDVLIDCDDATPAQEIERALALEVGAQQPWSLAVPDDEEGAVVTAARAGLQHGARIGLGVDTAAPVLPTSGLQLHVVSGQHAGLVVALPQGTHELGRGGSVA